MIVGNCITSAIPDDVCQLNSTSLQCSDLTADTCFCERGYTGNRSCSLSSRLSCNCDFSPRIFSLREASLVPSPSFLHAERSASCYGQ